MIKKDTKWVVQCFDEKDEDGEWADSTFHENKNKALRWCDIYNNQSEASDIGLTYRVIMRETLDYLM